MSSLHRIFQSISKSRRFLTMPLKRKAQENYAPRRSPRQPPSKPYVYETLLPGEIRILVLSPGKENEPLQATLETVSMDDKPRYKAISYAWGDAIFPHTLQLPSGQIAITDSLFGALKRFRREMGSVRLWADAVCINQDGILEKNHQVAVMDQIYERAEEVLVWLGEEHPSDCMALWTLEKLAALPNELFPFEVANEIKTQVLELPSDYLGCEKCVQCGSNLELSFRNKLDALSYFSGRPWFSRLWVIQEAYGATEYTVHFGRHVAASTIVETAYIVWPSDVHLDQGPLRWKRDDEAQQLHWASTMLIMTLSTQYRKIPRLLDTVFRAMDAKCSNSFDRVFAIRKLASVQDIDLLRPNYSLPIEDLWKRAAIVELTHPSTWELSTVSTSSPMLTLATAGVQRRFSIMDVPSWVPDLGNLGYECRRKHTFHSENSRLLWAGGTSIIHVVATKERSVLRIRGNLLCRIDETCVDSQYHTIFHDGLGDETADGYFDRLSHNVFPWFVKVIEFLTCHAEFDLDEDSALMALLQHGMDLRDRADPSFEHVTEAFQTWQKIAHPVINCKIEYDVVCEILYEYICLGEAMQLFIDRTRVLASTTTGHVGWIPEAAEPGDFVTLFEGSPYPFILRQRQDGYYSVIGDAYIEGIMYGEAWPEDGAGVDWIEIK